MDAVKFTLLKIVAGLIVMLAVSFIPVKAIAQVIYVPPGEMGDEISRAWDYFHDEDFKGAVDLLKQLLQKYPDNPLVEHTLGVFYLRERLWDDAAKYFQESMMHTSDEPVKLWNHIYLAEILREQGFPKRAEEHLTYVDAHELSSQQVRALAKIRMDLRVMEILDQTEKSGKVYLRFPHYLLPPDKIDEMGKKLNKDWQTVTKFLSLDGNESMEVFIYPSERLMEKFFPLTSTIREEDYAYGQVHTIYHGDGDYLSELAPYGYYLLARKYNRQGAPPWFVGGLDDAIRGKYETVSLNAWVSELFDQEKLPALQFLLDAQYLAGMNPGIKNPTAGSFILFLKNRFDSNDFLYILTQPNLEFNFKLTIDEIEVEWVRWLKREKSLIEDQEKVRDLVGKVTKFIEPPVVGMDLVEELKKAARIYESGDTEEAMRKVDAVLLRESRYGEALYLKAKILYDKSKLIDASDYFRKALIYLPASSTPTGWANYFMGRISKLRNDFPAARDYYSSAIAYPLPKEILEECKINIIKLDKFLSIRPNPAAVTTDKDIKNLKELLRTLDDIIQIKDWNSLRMLTAYDLNPQTMETFISWFQDPVRFNDNVTYTHELIKAELLPDMARLALNVKLSYKDNESKNKEYLRYMLLTRLPDGWRVMDYFDDLELYREGRIAYAPA